MKFDIMPKMPSLRQVPKLPTVEHFLFCYPLRSGIIFVAFVAVTMNVIPLLAVGFSYEPIMRSTVYGSLDRHQQTMLSAYDFLSKALLVIGCINIPINVLLIIGTVYRIPKLLLPWMNVVGIWISLILLILIPATVLILINNSLWFTGAIFFTISIHISWVIHILCVVRTYYEQIQEPHEEDTQKILPTQEKTPMKV